MLVRRIGIDFGTSTTVFAYKDYDKKGNTSNRAPKLLELGGRVMFPSIVFEPEGGMDRVYGFDAEEESRIAEGMLYANFKMDIMSEDRHDKACELIIGFFKYLRNIYKEECNRIGFADEEETWLSYPAAWPEQIQLEMEHIAREAGFVNIHVLDEPTVAIHSVLYQCRDQFRDSQLLVTGEKANVLIIDMGAGTTDLVVCRFVLGEKKPAERLLSWPPAASDDYFGGREMDDILTEYCICYCEKHNFFKRNFRLMKNKMSRNIKKWKEGEFSRALQTERKPPVPEIVESNVPDIAEQKDFKIVDRKSFEDVLEGLLETFPKMIKDCAEELRSREDGFDLFGETDLVILTGGNSSWYFIDEYLLGRREAESGSIEFARLKNQPGRLLRMGKPQQTVAYGLTLNERVLKNISEEFKTKNHEIGRQIKEIQNKAFHKVNEKKVQLGVKKKRNELYYKKLKDLESVVQLVNEAVAATGDSTKVLCDSPMANAIYLAGKGTSILGTGLTIGATTVLGTTGLSLGGIASAATAAGGLIGGAAVAGTFILAAPIAVLGVGGGLVASKAQKKQLHDEKERLLEEINRQIENVKRIRELEKNVVDERKKLMEMLETGLMEAAEELQSDLNEGK